MPLSRLLVPVSLLALGMAGVARGDGDWRAQQREGERLFDASEYRGALEAFKRAWAAHEDADLLFDIAECQRLLGDKAEAARAYRGYLRRKPGAENRGTIEALIIELEAPPAKAPTTTPSTSTSTSRRPRSRRASTSTWARPSRARPACPSRGSARCPGSPWAATSSGSG